MTTGKELTAIGKEIMEAAGWVRLACFNSHRAMPRGARGISDNIYIHEDVLLFIEDKGSGDSVTPEQFHFGMMISKFSPENVQYLVAESKEDYVEYSKIRKVE